MFNAGSGSSRNMPPCVGIGLAGMRRIIRRFHLRHDAGTAEKKEPERMSLYGVDLFGADASPKPGGPVAERFLFAPFSILDARAGEWQERKRAWLALGIKSEQ